MPEYTTRSAARRLRKDDRTIRRWIQNGRLSASKPHVNRYAIAESEITRIEREAGQASYAADLTALELRVAALEEKLTGRSKRALPARHLRTSEEPLIDRGELPEGSVRASTFAEMHQVKTTTFRYHLLSGLVGERPAYLALVGLGNPNEIERWLSPKQQELVLAFWDRHGVVHL